MLDLNLKTTKIIFDNIKASAPLVPTDAVQPEINGNLNLPVAAAPLASFAKTVYE